MHFSYANSLKVSLYNRFSVIDLACSLLNRFSVDCASVDLLNHLQNPRPDRLCLMLHKNNMLSSRIESRAGADLRSDQRHATGHELDRHKRVSFDCRNDDSKVNLFSMLRNSTFAVRTPKLDILQTEILGHLLINSLVVVTKNEKPDMA